MAPKRGTPLEGRCTILSLRKAGLTTGKATTKVNVAVGAVRTTLRRYAEIDSFNWF